LGELREEAMTDRNSGENRSLPPVWSDPWPSPQPAWKDPPWIMRGRAATAWFAAPRQLLEVVLSPDLRSGRSHSTRARVRFYDLAFEALDADKGDKLSPREGRFREMAIGFKAGVAGVSGEVSLFLWTDSETYLIWGREAFGWPIRLAEIDLSGALWEARDVSGTRGAALMRSSLGSAGLEDVQVLAKADAQPPSGVWLTPRRVLRRAGLDGEKRELLAVRPLVREPGKTYAATGHLTFSFPRPHPLHFLERVDAEVEVADGFELVVGAEVDVIDPPRQTFDIGPLGS
jgi:Acetoacetate decarboxylase (ADC)